MSTEDRSRHGSDDAHSGPHQASRGEQPRHPTPVVALGASAGGLEALKAFFAALSEPCGAVFMVILHQREQQASLLSEILERHVKLPVTTAEDGMAVQADRVFVAPPGRYLVIEQGKLYVLERYSHTGELPIDALFRSLAREVQSRAVAVVLSGTGSDGTLGVAEVKAAGGLVVAQAPESADYDGMPLSAIRTQLVDYVSTPADMPEQVCRYVRGLSDSSAPRIDDGELGDVLREILRVVCMRTGHDFSGYKPTTLRRRVERRMNVHGISDAEGYARFLRENPYEADTLFKELLISVTSFFRDPDAFDRLQSQLRIYFSELEEGSSFRAWVVGCATGEEAYSIAMLAIECLDDLDKEIHVQIFASDLDRQAVETARAARYPSGIAADVGEARLKRFFSETDAGYEVSKELRNNLIFATHNVLTDPPFTRLDLISCRNLMIYLEPQLQQKMVAVFHYALQPHGLLFLGGSESLGNDQEVFRSLDQKSKLFCRQPGEANLDRMPRYRIHAHGQDAGSGHRRDPALQPAAGGHTRISGIAATAARLLLSHLVPPTVLINEQGEIVYIHGRTGKYLEPPSGEPAATLVEMAREGLKLDLSAAIRQALSSKDEVVRRALRVKTNEHYERVRLRVRRVEHEEAVRGLLMVSFESEPLGREESEDASQLPPGDPDRVAYLEQELTHTKANLQGTIEELQTSNEELQSTNEELQSTNEELQSSNEELETSREETQSLNEELHTVNSELEERNSQLIQAHDDMQNLLNSTHVATLFLDADLAVKRYTSGVRELFHLIDSDVGRPISDLSGELHYDEMVDDACEVLETLGSKERSVQTIDGHWLQARVMPYRTSSNVIDGAVITFVDIDRLKRLEQEAQGARNLAESIIESIRDGLIVLDLDLRVHSTNHAFRAASGLTTEPIQGRPFFEVGNGMWNEPKVRELLERLCGKGESFRHEPFRTRARDGAEHRLLLTGRMLDEGPQGEPLVLLIIEVQGGSELSARA